MKIHLFGLGAIGSNLLLQLASMYPECSFSGVDFDKVEERNIATQAYLMPHIKLAKTKAMQIILGLKVKKSKYTGHQVKIENASYINEKMVIDPENDLIIDCFDNSSSRTIIHRLQGYANILHIGFSPQYTAELIWNDEYSVPGDIPPEAGDICGMNEAVPFINFVVSLGARSIFSFFREKSKKSYLVLPGYRIREL